jgi:hypothetical protein
MSSTERKIAAKPLDFAPGRPAITPADRASVAAPAAPTPTAALEPLIAAGAADKAGGIVAGLKGVVVYLEPAEAIALKVYAAQNSTSIQQLGTEAFAELFRKRGINGGVLTRVRANRKHGGNR